MRETRFGIEFDVFGHDVREFLCLCSVAKIKENTFSVHMQAFDAHSSHSICADD